jgi:hypothetical protein
MGTKFLGGREIARHQQVQFLLLSITAWELARASARDVNNRYPAIALSTFTSGSPCIAIGGYPIDVAHAKAAPLAGERQTARATAAVLEDFDNLFARLVLAYGSRAEDADIVFIQRAHASAVHDGLPNDLIGHGWLPSGTRRCMAVSCS